MLLAKSQVQSASRISVDSSTFHKQTTGVNLLKNQFAKEKERVPGWHMIEEDESESENSSQQSDTGKEKFRTDESRLSSHATPEQNYFNFIATIGKAPRFSEKELRDLKEHFRKGAKKIKVNVENDDGTMKEKTETVMYLKQFREQMGLLGQRQNPFLADRIFEVFDKDKDGMLTCDEFTGIMDVLCNGDEDEKNQFSFALMDID